MPADHSGCSTTSSRSALVTTGTKRHLVEPVLLGGIRFAVSHGLPLIAVTVQDTPRLRRAAIRVEVAAVVDPEDRCGRDFGRLRKVVFDPVGGSHVRGPVEIGVRTPDRKSTRLNSS